MRTKRPFRKRLFRFLKWSVGIVVGVAIVAIISLRIYFWRIAGELPEARRLAQSVGVPLQEDELYTGAPKIDEGAGPLYDQAIALYSKTREIDVVEKAIQSRFETDDTNYPLSDAEAKEAWQLVEPTYQLIHKIAAYPKARYMPTPTYPAFYESEKHTFPRHFVRLLCERAEREAKKGNDSAALTELLAAARICSHMDQQEGELSMMIAQASRSTVQRYAERAIRFSAKPEWWIDPLRKIASELSPKRTFLDALRGEAYYSIQIARDLEGYRKAVHELPDAFPEYEASSTTESNFRFLVGGTNFDHAQEARLCQYWYEAFSAAKVLGSDSKEFQLRRLQLRDKYAESWDPANLLAGLSSWAYINGSEIAARSGAIEAVVAQAADIFEFYGKNRRWPNRPQDVSGWRRDPFDQEALRLLPRPNGFVVYSIGQDEVDDGGRSVQKRDGTGGVDIVFAFPWRPEPSARTSTP